MFIYFLFLWENNQKYIRVRVILCLATLTHHVRKKKEEEDVIYKNKDEKIH